MSNMPLASGESSSSNSNAAALYQNALQELFGPDGQVDVDTVRRKYAVLNHPLFEHLLEAHVACLRAATPMEQQHVLDSALASNQHHVAAKYLAFVSLLQAKLPPADDVKELHHFMVKYTLLLKSFKEQLEDHVKIQASNAIMACQEIEQKLFDLTGVKAMADSEESMQGHSSGSTMAWDRYADACGLSCLEIHAFLPQEIQKNLREYMRQELKRELLDDYGSKLKEVHDEILRKRRAGKLPADTTDFLKDWWQSHSTWPYPTDEEKIQMMEETGLELKQINNWFINHRKRHWHSET